MKDELHSSEATPSILLLEDDVRLRERLALSLNKKNFQVTQVGSCEEVEHLFAVNENSNKSFDFAIVDLCLEGESGLKTVELLKLKSPKTKVAVLTGFGTIETALDAGRLGVTSYLSKPTTVDSIVQSLLKAPEKFLKAQSEDLQVCGRLERIEREELSRVLTSTAGNISKSARILGISRRTLHRKIKEFPELKQH